MKSNRSTILMAMGACTLALTQMPAAAAPKGAIHLPSTPATVVRGIISADRKPVLTIKSGQTVVIDSVSHGGLTDDPVKFFGEHGIPADQVLKDAIDIAKIPRTEGFGGHVLTGPIYVEGAEPGDILEVRVRKVVPRVPYGVNNAGPGGVDPTLVPVREAKVIKYDMKRMVGRYPSGIEVPLSPFMGIMAVAPAGAAVGSRMPGRFGGNLDFKGLKDGATLYLPVQVPGALFYTGDPHAAQGDGEVSGNAIEASLTATFEFILHKGGGDAMRFPRAEDAKHYYSFGIDADLTLAYRYAVSEAVKFLVGKGFTASDAYSVSSTTIDFGVAEAVNGTLVGYGRIPKVLIPGKVPAYWKK